MIMMMINISIIIFNYTWMTDWATDVLRVLCTDRKRRHAPNRLSLLNSDSGKLLAINRRLCMRPFFPSLVCRVLRKHALIFRRKSPAQIACHALLLRLSATCSFCGVLCCSYIVYDVIAKIKKNIYSFNVGCLMFNVVCWLTHAYFCWVCSICRSRQEKYGVL